MVNAKSLKNLKPCTKENARERQKKSAEKRVKNRTLFEALDDLDEDGTIATVFDTILRSGREENQVKLLAMAMQYKDKLVARKNGELDNKVFVYEPMQFTKVEAPK